jgi:hypothetical protein
MNMANNDYEDQDFEYRFDSGRKSEPDGRRGGNSNTSNKRRAQYARASRAPAMHNGIHRRRNKRFAW